jgi:hypothetical protein
LYQSKLNQVKENQFNPNQKREEPNQYREKQSNRRTNIERREELIGEKQPIRRINREKFNQSEETKWRGTIKQKE